MARFRFIDPSGKEVSIETVAEIAAAVKVGAISPSTLLFDQERARWAPASEHDAVAATLSTLELPAFSEAGAGDSSLPLGSEAEMEESYAKRPPGPIAAARVLAAVTALLLAFLLLATDAALLTSVEPTATWASALSMHLGTAFWGASWRSRRTRPPRVTSYRALFRAALAFSFALVMLRTLAAFQHRSVLDPSVATVIATFMLNVVAALVASAAVVAGEYSWPSKARRRNRTGLAA